MRTFWLIIVGLIFMSSGCGTPTKSQMQDRFDRLLQKCIGESEWSSLTQSMCMKSHLADEIKILSSGNRVITYNDYWGIFNIRRKGCRVSFELKGETIIATQHEGPGCYAPY